MPYTIDCFACTPAGHLALTDDSGSTDMGLNADDIGALQSIADYAKANASEKAQLTEQFNHIYERVNLTRLVTLKLLTFKDPNNERLQRPSHPLFAEWQNWQADKKLSEHSVNENSSSQPSNQPLSQATFPSPTDEMNELGDDVDNDLEPALRLRAGQDF